jgi:hypothetical protein
VLCIVDHLLNGGNNALTNSKDKVDLHYLCCTLLRRLMHLSRRSSVMQFTVYEGCYKVVCLRIILDEGTEDVKSSLDGC